MNNKIKFLTISLLFGSLFVINSQNRVAISDKNDMEAHESAILELISDDKGFLLPRMETDQRNSISDPAESLMIFNTETKCIETYISGEWLDFWCLESEGFQCGDPFTDDRDGYVYQTVEIGDQCWFAENLRATEFSDGTPITLAEDNEDWNINYIDGEEESLYCWYNNDYNTYGEIYGALYNSYAARTSGGNLCPEGWFVASDDDWKELEVYLGMSPVDADETGWRGSPVGSKLAGDTDDDLWEEGDLINHSDFNKNSDFFALPAGYRTDEGVFQNVGEDTGWWTSQWGHYRRINYDRTDVIRLTSLTPSYGFSVRCIKEVE